LDDQSRHAEPNDPQVDAALRDYLERVDRGERIDREEFLARHAPIADQLRSFIAVEGEMRKLAGAEAPLDLADDSTKSFVRHGQETIMPQSVGTRSAESGETGLAGQFGRYRIIRVLGKGAMGAVYLAEDTQLERSVAIKTPHFTENPTEESLERFYREARVAATLRQPNICPVFDVGQIEGKHYISMAYIEGRSLSAFIKPDKPQTERQILIVIRKLALALQEAHDHGIVHRDLKPANIIVDKKGEPIIMDFGLARQTRGKDDIRLTQTGNIIGTPAYMSPEQVEGEPSKIGPSTDQYSLGAILYELLTGDLPFRGSVIAVMGQILTKELTPPSQLRPDLDPRIEAVCLKMMAKTPSKRFASLKAVADELATILKNAAAKSTPSQDKLTSFSAQSPAGDRLRADVGASQVLKSLKQKTLTESDVASLEELARKCYSRRDFEQVIQIIERIPEEKRNAGLVALLEKARGKVDEIAFLICDMDEAERLNDVQTALKKAEALLTVKPGHHRALEVQEKYSGYGEGGAARIGVLDQFRRPLNDGGWIPWSVLAFGLAILAVMTGIIVIQIGKTAIVIKVEDPEVTVEVAAKGNKIEIVRGPREEKVEVEPGEQELKISYGGLETRTKRFELKKGQKRQVTVSIVNREIVADLDRESLPVIKGSEEAGPGQPAGENAGGERLAAVQKKTGLERPNPAAKAEGPAILVAPFDQPAATKSQERWVNHLSAPVQTINSIGMPLRLIPPGRFQMGSPESADQLMKAFPYRGREMFSGEGPVHSVTISHPFYIGQYEVTLVEFQSFVDATGYQTDVERTAKGGWGRMRSGDVNQQRGFNWRNNGEKQERDWPVVNVSFNDATAFCAWLSKKEGKRYRLPTEAEWEYACRAGSTERYYNGDDPKELTKIANVAIQSVRNVAHPVGHLAANQFGLFDMLGNATEWCSDWYGEDYYANSPAVDPAGPPRGDVHVHRGGSWYARPDTARCARRGHDHDSVSGFAWIGFRVVCETGAAENVPVGQDVVTIPAEENKPVAAVPGTPAVRPKSNVASTASKILGRPFLVRGEWRIENDELVQPTLAAPKDLCPLFVFGEETLSNYDLTLEAKKTGGRHGIGVFFHWLGAEHFREFNLWANKDTNFPYTYNGKAGRETGPKELHYASNRWYSLKFEARGDRFRVYVDGVLQFDQTDARFTRGRICLVTWGTTARFRRIKISDPQGLVLFEGLPELPSVSNKANQKADIGNSSRSLTAGEAAAKSAQQEWAERSKTPVIVANSLGMKLALIPPGEFQMGSPKSERGRGRNEQQHRVRITKPFYLGAYEITQSEFERVTGRNPSFFSNGGDQAEAATGLDTSRYPVESVTWYDAVEFCNKLSEKEGRRPYYRIVGIEREAQGSITGAKVSVEGGGGYRLPTEAQWEYACRAGTSTPFNFGQADNGAQSNCSGEAPYGTEERGPALGRTVPVGSYQPNAFGLYDMHGNVWEWCWDVFDDSHHKNSPESDPIGPPRTPKAIRKKSKTNDPLESDPAGSSGGSERVRRGGSWLGGAARSRSAFRRRSTPDHQIYDLGFRVARSSEE
jgi:formylglycine-generating enzyme required for sulfatase activity/serine/threonine protein kinase